MTLTRARNTISIGDEYGHLTVLDVQGRGTRNDPRVITAQCKCGNTVTMGIHDLKVRKTCGCRSLFRERMRRVNPRIHGTEETALRHYYRKCIRSAHERFLAFELDLEQFRSLVFGDCYYCGTPPRTLYRVGGNQAQGNASEIYRNGIDRVNNDIGYSFDNCVTCCRWCNLMKHTHTHDEFVDQIMRIAGRFSPSPGS